MMYVHRRKGKKADARCAKWGFQLRDALMNQKPPTEPSDTEKQGMLLNIYKKIIKEKGDA